MQTQFSVSYTSEYQCLEFQNFRTSVYLIFRISEAEMIGGDNNVSSLLILMTQVWMKRGTYCVLIFIDLYLYFNLISCSQMNSA